MIGEGTRLSGDLDLNGLLRIDGDFSGTEDPLSIAEGCFEADRAYPRDRLVITFPVPTVCAIGGHAFGAGLMIALCHDVRVMRRDRVVGVMVSADDYNAMRAFYANRLQHTLVETAHAAA